jgi:hypothetical protein
MMNNPGKNADFSKLNFYLNLSNIFLFLIAGLTGSLIQINYHMHGLPAAAWIAGLDKSAWMLLHKASAAIFLAGAAAHCLVNRRFISASLRRVFSGKFLVFKSLSFWVFVVCVLTCLPAVVSWMLFDARDPGRYICVESHDKLGLFLIPVTVVHIFRRAGKMTGAYRVPATGKE